MIHPLRWVFARTVSHHWHTLTGERTDMGETPDLPPPADPVGTQAPATLPVPATDQAPIFALRRIVKQSLTKRSRRDLNLRMVDMCSLSGWQSTTLNPDMSTEAKLSMLTARFGKIASEDQPDALYDELIVLSAVSMGWAQGIARREWREQKRAQRATKRAAREEKRRDKGRDDKDKDG